MTEVKTGRPPAVVLTAARRQLLERAQSRRLAGPTPRPAGVDVAPMTAAQEQMWMLDRFAGDRVMAAAPLCFRLRGALTTSALATAYAALVRRHEGLRTTFGLVDGEPAQHIHDPSFLDWRADDLRDAPDAWRARVDDEVARTFDLATGPLVRGRLYALADDDHVLLVTRHHITFDERSDAILLDELARLYRAARDGHDAGLEPLSFQCADLALWERTPEESARSLVLVERYAATVGAAPLPAAFARGRRGRTSAARVFETGLPASVDGGLRTLAGNVGALPAAALLALLRLALWRATGAVDLLVGTPMSARSPRGADALIGCFVNMVAIRQRVDPSVTVAGHVVAGHAAYGSALDFRSVPFAALARTVGASVGLDVTFAYAEDQPRPWALDGVDTSPVEPTRIAIQRPLEVKAIQSREGMRLLWAFDEAAVPRETVEGVAAALSATVAEVVADPTKAVASFAPITPAAPDPEPQPIVVAWSRPARPDRPLTPVEAEVAACWDELLGCGPIAPDVSIIDLGGHSLTVTKLAFLLEERVGTPLDVIDLLDNPTVAGHAAVVAAAIEEAWQAMGGDEAAALIESLEGEQR